MKQPEALQLADLVSMSVSDRVRGKAAAELRRLHEVNTELLEALKQVTTHAVSLMKAQSIARAAIAKALGEKHGSDRT